VANTVPSSRPRSSSPKVPTWPLHPTLEIQISGEGQRKKVIIQQELTWEETYLLFYMFYFPSLKILRVTN
jgi:hypothetical protein